MDDTVAPYQEEPIACPFVALEDDRDRRTDRPDYRHRCFASRQPEPRAYPHQERYCLSRGFTECPIFLDWARREAATVIPARRSQPAPAAPLAEEEDVAAAAAAPEEPGEQGVPPFLVGRGRSAARLDEEPAPAPRPEEGLWGPEDAGRRRPQTAPSGAVVGRARANVKHPDWEAAPHIESYPRIRDRRGIGRGLSLSIPPVITVGVVVIAVALLSFLVLPGILWPSGTASRPTPSPTPAITASPSPTPVPSPTQFTYVIRKNDTLTSISTRFCVSIDEILAANKTAIPNADTIAEGQQIVIPATATCPTGNGTPTPAVGG